MKHTTDFLIRKHYLKITSLCFFHTFPVIGMLSCVWMINNLWFSIMEQAKPVFLSSVKSQGILYQVRELLYSSSESWWKDREFYPWLGTRFANANFISKNIFKGIDCCGFIVSFIGKAKSWNNCKEAQIKIFSSDSFVGIAVVAA